MFIGESQDLRGDEAIQIPEPVHIRFRLREGDVSSFLLRWKVYCHITRALDEWNWTVCNFAQINRHVVY